MFSKKVLSSEETLLAKTLNVVEREGVKSMANSVLPKIHFTYNEEKNSTRVFSEVRLDQLSPEIKTFMLSALEASKEFAIEKTRDGSPYDCAIFEKSVRGHAGLTHESQALYTEALRDRIESSIQSYSSDLRKDLFGKGFPVKLPNPFSETKADGEGVFAKFRQKIQDRDTDNAPSIA